VGVALSENVVFSIDPTGSNSWATDSSGNLEVTSEDVDLIYHPKLKRFLIGGQGSSTMSTGNVPWSDHVTLSNPLNPSFTLRGLFYMSY
jgi:hypothetical protein